MKLPRALLLVFLLAGCQTVSAEGLTPPTAPAVPLALTAAPSPTAILPTPVIAGLETPASSQPLAPTPEPLRFVFPEPGPEPVSAWRPALYPIPWEPTPYDHFYFARPIGADEVNWPLANYRYGGVFFKDEVHTGIDIPAPRGTPVLASAAGRVMWAGFGLYSQTEDPDDPYGLAVSIKHDFGYQGNTLFTVYGHMDQITVRRGQWVEAGEQIGYVGDTGHVTGVHLHFEVRLGKNNYFTSRNPELWIAPPQGWGILAARVMKANGELLDHQSVFISSYDTGRKWEVRTYGGDVANLDPYYQENMVIGDLPAGNYRVWISYDNSVLDQDIQIWPGMVSYFTYWGRDGFHVDPPPAPRNNFEPPAPLENLP